MAAVEVVKQAGTVGYIKDYVVVVLGDRVSVFLGDQEITTEVMDGLGRFAASAGDLRVGWGETADFEILYLYDKADGGFGYAVSLSCGWCSEWGYAPFAA